MEKAKNLGNEAFKEGRCEEAIEAYTEALGYDALNTIYNSTVYCNRAAAKMKIKQYKEALEDCEESIKLNEGYIKAYTRKAECLIQTQEYESAIHVRGLPRSHPHTHRLIN
jgi:DnaJ family protein C protein 7